MQGEEEVAATADKLEDLQVDDGLDLKLGEKKKKKKKKPAFEDGTGEEAPVEEDDDAAQSFDLSLAKKKKKKPRKRAEEEFGGLEEEKEGLEGEEATENGAATTTQKGSGLPWEASDRDYSYEELLDRVFGILKENNPELTGEKRRTILKPPMVAREGTKKTVFTNFYDLCKSMNRSGDHVQQFLLAELGTSGNLDGQNRLIVKGRFLPKAFEGVLRRYMNEYVLCNSCKSPDTLLDRDSASRIMFLRCQQCGASRTVAAIKAGYVARITRRPKTG
eukprot:jgi/Botrbrau1/4407/Bobra.0348s0001.2